jgi:tRNA (cmo5U34)-methyltransferase
VNGASGPERFYGLLAGDYDDAILRCVPRYFEMLDAILGYVPAGSKSQRILELGSGSGHLTRRIRKAFPDAEIYAIDLSREMLIKCQETTDPSRLQLLRMDFENLSFAPDFFDLVVSSISIHHIDHPAKQKLFRQVFQCLRPGGVLAYSDQFAGDTDEIYRKHMEAWKKEAAALGASAQEWAAWMQHQEDHDHHASLRDQLAWLQKAGFAGIDCVWRYLLWTVMVAERPVDPDSRAGS